MNSIHLTHARPPAASIGPNPGRWRRGLVRLGKELEYHMGSGAHALFGIRNMAVAYAWEEYLLLGRRFVRTCAMILMVVGGLIGLNILGSRAQARLVRPGPGIQWASEGGAEFLTAR